MAFDLATQHGPQGTRRATSGPSEGHGSLTFSLGISLNLCNSFDGVQSLSDRDVVH